MNSTSFDSSDDILKTPSNRRRRGIARNSSNSEKYTSLTRGTERTYKLKGSRSSCLSPSPLLSPSGRRFHAGSGGGMPPRSPFRSPRYATAAAGRSPGWRRQQRMMMNSPKQHHDRITKLEIDIDHTDDILNGLFRESSLRVHNAKKELETDNMDSLSSMLENSRLSGSFLFGDDGSSSSDSEESSIGFGTDACSSDDLDIDCNN